MLILFVFSFLAGLCTILSPCILPIIPIVLAVGTSKGKLRPLGVSIGVVVSFTFFTAALATIVHVTGVSSASLRNIAIGCVFLFGLVMCFPVLSNRVSKIFSPIAHVGDKIQKRAKPTGLLGGLFVGFALGLIWTPCAGPILASMVALISSQTITPMVVSCVLAYAIGASIPLFLLALGGSSIVRTSKFVSRHAEGVRQFFGLITILIAVLLAFHWDLPFQQKIALYLPSVPVEDNSMVNDQLKQLEENVHMRKMERSPEGSGLKLYGKAPELKGIQYWINSEPLTLQELNGKVVLLDFWTYTCTNCIRTLPYIKKLYATYKDKGLVVIGIHSPEFDFEINPENVKDAVSRLGITYPVGLDNVYKVWQAYHNHYWPAHYLIDQNGNIVSFHFGEGGYAELEGSIRKLLGLSPLSPHDGLPMTREISPETYLGTDRARNYTSETKIVPNKLRKLTYTRPLKPDEIGLKGLWRTCGEFISSESNESYLDFNFIGRKVYLVLSGSSAIPLEVYVDGTHVSDLYVDGDRRYEIVEAPYGRHLLSLKVPKSIQAYAFTFGDE